MATINIQKIPETNYDKLLLVEWNGCYASSRDINDVNYKPDAFGSWAEVRRYYGDLPYVVEDKDRQCLGFFFDDFDNRSNALGLSVYLNRDYWTALEAAKILNTIIFVGTMHDYNLYRTNNVKFLELNTFSHRISDMVKGIIPNVEVHTVRDEYIIVHGVIDRLDLSKLDYYYESLLVENDGVLSYVFDIPDEIIVLPYGNERKMKIRLFGEN